MKKLIYFLVLVLVLSVGAWSQAIADDTTVVSHQVSQEAMQATATYWTPERMRAAKPAPMPVPGEGVGVADVGVPGTPGAVKGGPGGSQTSALLSEDEFAALAYTGALAEDAAAAPTANGYNYPPPHNTYNILTSLYGTTSSTYPYRVVGKVFFTQNMINYVCSGSSIGGRAVLTAGHCVSDGSNTWNTNTTFVPSYRNNVRPYGTWVGSNLWTFTAWHTTAQLGRDVGFIITTDIGGLKLSQRVGYLGFAWNFTRVLMWNMFGYPAAAPYNGAWQVTTQASYARTDLLPTPDTTGIGTAQTGGCSGGPWIKTFKHGISGACNYANGVNSYIYINPNQPFQIYSPYFDTAVHDFWAQMIIL
jgi:hypothetical protein